MTLALQRLELGDLAFDVVLDARVGADVVAPPGLLATGASTKPSRGLIAVDLVDELPRRPLASVATLFHGRVQVFVEEDGTLHLDDGCASVCVEPGGHTIRASLLESVLRDHGLFARTTIPMALALALRWHSRFHVHAGLCTAADGTTTLLVGPSGAGKSTTTALLSEAGWQAWSDDACLLWQSDSHVVAAALPRPFHLAAEVLPHVPSLWALGWDEIAPGRLEARRAPASSKARAVDRVVLIAPERAPTTAVSVVSPADGVAGLLESSALLAADGVPQRQAHFALLGALARQVTSLRLVPGPDFFDDPRAVQRRIDAAARGVS